jgi:hypothetical protein
MGFRASWVAVNGGDLDAMLELTKLACVDVDEVAPTASVIEKRLFAAKLRSGWTVLVAVGSDDYDRLGARHARALSQGAKDALHFRCNEASMTSELNAYRDAKNVWSVEYVGTDGVAAPDLTGEVPPLVDEVIDRIAREQRSAGPGVDLMFDCPTLIGEAMTGFRHDSTLVEPILVAFELYHYR